MTDKVRWENHRLYWEGKALYAEPDPEYSALRKLPQQWEEACLYVVAGPGLGYGLSQALVDAPPSSRLLLVEWQPELAVFSQERLRGLLVREGGLRLAFPNLHQVPEKKHQNHRMDQLIRSLHDFLENDWSLWSFRRVRLLALNRSFALERFAYQEIMQWLEDYMRNFWHNRLTMEKLGPLWLRNLLRNVSQFSACQGLPPGDPSATPPIISFATKRNIVLAAAGPSLQWHYDWLRREREQFTLMAVDTALLPLLQAGILPDYVMNLDAQVRNLEDFYGSASLLHQLGQGKQTSLVQIADLSCDPRSFAMLPGSFILTQTHFAPLRLWQRLRSLQEHLAELRGIEGTLSLELEPLGSVAITLLAAALQARPDFLLLAGYDFAYPPDLQHVPGSSIHQSILRRHGRLQVANSFTASMSRCAQHLQPEGLRQGFVTDAVLQGYARQLQGYLNRYASSAYAHLPGPWELPGIPCLSPEQARRQLGANCPVLRPTSVSSKLGRQSQCDAAIRKFWHREQELLLQLHSELRTGRLAPQWWQQTDYAADYLLKLCLPKAGYSETERPKLLRVYQLSENLISLLSALLQ